MGGGGVCVCVFWGVAGERNDTVSPKRGLPPPLAGDGFEVPGAGPSGVQAEGVKRKRSSLWLGPRPSPEAGRPPVTLSLPGEARALRRGDGVKTLF